MADTLHLKIVSPSKLVYDDEVEMVVLNGIEGEFGVLKGHENFSTSLSYGVIRIEKEGKKEFVGTIGGFAEISEKGVTILTDDAHLPHEVDEQRALDAKKRAEDRLSRSNSEVDAQRAELALRRALVRLETLHYNR